MLLVPVFMSLLAVSSINVALPSLQRGLDASDAELQWSISVDTLAFGMVLVPAGRAGDLLGRARLFRIGVLGFGLGALLPGLSPWWLLATLGLFGMGQGLTVSPNQTLSLAEVPRPQSGSAGGILQTGQRVGTSVGSAVIVGVYLGVAGTGGPDRGFMAALGLIAVSIAAALAVALADQRRRARQGGR
ncbi:MFS transporter [Micrococcus porci]|uniref:MFS transporter n=1 Tax=Micrococcus porci TaxID=2856555 RepID=UPI003CE7651F